MRLLLYSLRCVNTRQVNKPVIISKTWCGVDWSRALRSWSSLSHVA